MQRCIVALDVRLPGISCRLWRFKQVWDLTQSLWFLKEKCFILSLAVHKVAFVHVLIYRASLYQTSVARWINSTQYLFLGMAMRTSQ